MPLATANFTRETFATLLRSESLRCVRVANERQCLPPIPEAVVYYFPTTGRRFAFSEDRTEVIVPPDAVISEEDLLPHLFRAVDGHFRWEIMLSPFAVTERKTVIEVYLRDPTWTNQVIIGECAFPHEPFQLRGPTLPASHKDGEPIPRVSLPALRVGIVPAEDQDA